MKPIIAIAISGGIDSLMAGYLLKKQGYHLFGIHFRTGYGSVDPKPVARQLKLSLEIIDIREAFHHTVIDYFSRTYRSGKTPNPCLVCNPAVKFGLVFEHARKLGASQLATGHYARIIRNRQGQYHLLRGLDPIKDQSYFLSRLNQEQLARARFPLGRYTKKTVKALALEKGFKPAAGKESQDVCFIDEQNYSDFLIDQCGLKSKPGVIEDVDGNEIGSHQGLHRFTIGQRRGINCPAAEPYYVVRLDIPRNRLIVGFKQDLLSTACRVTGINWIGSRPNSAIDVFTKVRYRHEAARSTVNPTGNDSAELIFHEPQQAVTPGQGAVFYDNDAIIGSGWIE